MKLPTIIFAIATAMAVVAATTRADFDKEPHVQTDQASSRGLRRFQPSMSCEKFPRICRQKGSAGPECCKKKCADVKNDRSNCGMCGYMCKNGEICCKGQCINASFDKINCGGCNNKCKNGEFCVYGMCN